MADYGIRKYRLGGPVLSGALIDGFTLDGDSLVTCGDAQMFHSAFLRGIDSAQPGCEWGRLSLKYNLGIESMLTVRVFASDQDSIIHNNRIVKINDFLLDGQIPRKDKERLFMAAGGAEYSGAADMLLSEQNGRWLWVWLEVTGEEPSILENIRVYVPGDHFFRTLPQVYQQNNDFLKRYLSIFSTIYHEMQEKIDSLPELLDVDIAPEELLPVFASWLGLETDPMLFGPDELRSLLKIAPKLMEYKGTKWAVETALKLFVSEDVYIVERNLLMADQRHSEDLYGKTHYDFTIMIARKMDEKLRLRLQFLIDQVKPMRSRYNIVFLEECGGLDAFTYLDLNGAVLQSEPGNLDFGNALAGMTYLE